MSQSYINVIGAGLAGSEAAYQMCIRDRDGDYHATKEIITGVLRPDY